MPESLAGKPGLADLVDSPRFRLLRFAITGGTGAMVQLVLLRLFEQVGVPALVANMLAFLSAAQLNFMLSHNFTWSDRRSGQRESESLRRRWSNFHLAIAGTAALNMLIFSGILYTRAVPDLIASATGIGVAAVANYVLGDRLVFRGAPLPIPYESDADPN